MITLSADHLISSSQAEPTYLLLSASDCISTAFTTLGKGETSIVISTELQIIMPSAASSFIEPASYTSESILSVQVAPSTMPLLSPDTEPLSNSWYSSQLVLSSSPMSEGKISESRSPHSSQVSSGGLIVPVTSIQSAMASSYIQSEPIPTSTTQAAVPVTSQELEPSAENEHYWSATASVIASKPTFGAAAENPNPELSESTDEQHAELSNLPATTTIRGQKTSLAPTVTTLKPTTTPSNPCKAVQCSNNGIVNCEIVDGKAKYQCKCPSGFYGDKCQSKCRDQHTIN